MKVSHETLKVSELVDARRNANKMRTEHREMLSASMLRTAFLQPICVSRRPDGKLVIIDGHHRRDAVKSLGREDIDAVVLEGIDESREEAIGLGLNRYRGEPQLEVAAAIVHDLVRLGFNPDDMVITGFTDDEIRDFNRLKMDDLPNADVDVPESNASRSSSKDDKPKTWTITATFENEIEYRRVNSFLRKLSGRGSDFSVGLLALADTGNKKDETSGKDTEEPAPADKPKKTRKAKGKAHEPVEGGSTG